MIALTAKKIFIVSRKNLSWYKVYQFIVPCLFRVASWDGASALFVVTLKYQNTVTRPPQSLLFSG